MFNRTCKCCSPYVEIEVEVRTHGDHNKTKIIKIKGPSNGRFRVRDGALVTIDLDAWIEMGPR